MSTALPLSGLWLWLTGELLHSIDVLIVVREADSQYIITVFPRIERRAQIDRHA